jgi:hypothetical protein
MRARFYDIRTGLTLFGADITECDKGGFIKSLKAAGFEYIKHRDCWVDKKQSVECIIWQD